MIDGYPVIKKSLDCRHTGTPRRTLRSAGVRHFSELIQCIVTIPKLDPVHDANYQANKASALKSLV